MLHATMYPTISPTLLVTNLTIALVPTLLKVTPRHITFAFHNGTTKATRHSASDAKSAVADRLAPIPQVLSHEPILPAALRFCI